MWWLLNFVVWAAAGAATAVLLGIALVRKFVFPQPTEPGKCTVAFFHPYCDAGGGGERVLWCAIAALANVRDLRHLRVIIYCGDATVRGSEIVARATERFGITIARELDLQFVQVHKRHLLEAARWPRFTMLGQSLGSMVLAWECLRAYCPDIWIDTTGYAFTYPVAKLLANCTVAAYVHYPTITSDMLRRVHERRPTYNNDAAISASDAATRAKLIYYHLFAALYRVVGGFADAIMANSSWTQAHITQLWGLPSLDASGNVVAGARAADAVEAARQVLSESKSASETRAGGSDGAASARKRRRQAGAAADGGDAAVGAPSADGSDSARERAIAAASLLADAAANEAVAQVHASHRQDALESMSFRLVHGIIASLVRGFDFMGSARRRPVAKVVYPPCNTTALQQLPLGTGAARSTVRTRTIVSVAQFRPEKDHALQLRAFAEFRKRRAEYADIRLVLIGGCRDDGDRSRMEALRGLATELGIPTGNVEFRPNIPLGELRSALGGATAGLHTMWNEHFGIGVVEMMAAGVATIAHDSAGPRMDIVRPYEGQQTGFLATTPAEYADALEAVFASDSPVDVDAMTTAARASVSRFSDEEFAITFFASVIGMVRSGQSAVRARADSSDAR